MSVRCSSSSRWKGGSVIPKDNGWGTTRVRREVTGRSHDRPRVRAPRAGFGEPAPAQEVANAVSDRVDLGGREQRLETVAEGPEREVRPEPAQVLEEVLRDRLVDEVPDHRPELGLDVEADAVVHDEDPAVPGEQAVARLAVGIVLDQVEE